MDTGKQKGEPQHGEGRQGEKTHGEFIEGLHGRHGGSQESEGSPQPENDAEREAPIAGHHRLFEERRQHDEAEKNSEHNRQRR